VRCKLKALQNHGRDAPAINSTKKLSLFECPEQEQSPPRVCASRLPNFGAVRRAIRLLAFDGALLVRQLHRVSILGRAEVNRFVTWRENGLDSVAPDGAPTRQRFAFRRMDARTRPAITRLSSSGVSA
jgi:hypothetical protein